MSRLGTTRFYVEGDFFGDGDTFRLRHAFGQFGRITAGKTWTTFSDEASIPQTLDFEGSGATISLRRAQIRWTEDLTDKLQLAFAIEDPRETIEVPEEIEGDERTPTPDFVIRSTYTTDWGQLGGAFVYRELGYQVTGFPVITADAWGFNFSGTVSLTPCNDAYFQINFGEGIGSFRSLPDVVARSNEIAEVLPVFGWLVGLNHAWTKRLSSNFTYGQGDHRQL